MSSSDKLLNFLSMAKFSIKTPFKFIWSTFKKSMFMIGLLVTIAYFGLIFYLSNSSDNKIELPEQGFVLDLSIEGEIVDYNPGPKSLALNLLNDGPKRYNISQLLKIIERASTDQRVKGVFINWSGSQSNLSQQIRINNALAKLRKERAQLPIYFYSNNIDHGALLISATANRIAVPPVANFLITGPVMQLMYFGEAAERLGIGFTVFQTGPHKAVFEPYIRSSPSQEVLTEYTQINEEITVNIIDRISEFRGDDVSENQVREWFKQSIYTVESALENNVITDIAYIDDFFSEFQSETGTNYKTVKAMDYFRSSEEIDKHFLAKENSAHLAIIEAYGAISQQGNKTSGSESGIFANDIIDQLNWAKEDDDIAAVIIRISSPGGSAQASELIWHYINQLSEVKPVVVSMGTVAASGGYYMAAAADAIVAEPTTITGSIGVTALLPELENLQDKIGVYLHTITDSDRKALLSIEEKPTDLDIALVNAGIQETYQTFLNRVSEGRSLSLEKLEKIAGGRVYTGTTAKSLGLVDEIGDTNTALFIAKNLAGLDSEKLYPIKTYTAEGKSIISCVIQKGWDNCVSSNFLKHIQPNPLHKSIEKISGISSLIELARIFQSESKGPIQLTYLPVKLN